jgi:glycosyltransferase involved in cell wall biosynthesis
MRMIFHHPLPIAPGSASASGIRPLQMMEAFRSLGIEVDAVCGYAAERAQAVARIERNIGQGVRYAFMYGESSTEPTLLTNPHHLPLHPWLDFGFFARLKARSIPLGVFYRDIYWRFPGYGAGLAWWKKAAAQLFYRYDLLQYRRLLDRLYLPSMAMARHVPWFDGSRMAALPPGSIERSPTRPPGGALRLLYIGGMGDHYRMHELFRAIASLPGVELTVCTRVTEWAAVRHEYPLPASGRIRVVHRSGTELGPLLDAADLCVLCVKPHPYWEFAAPVKLYEYVGASRPVIASRGTLAGEFVEQQGIGWAVDYGADPIAALLQSLLDKPAVLQAPTEATHRIRREHTWQARARQVADDLAEAR